MHIYPYIYIHIYIHIYIYIYIYFNHYSWGLVGAPAEVVSARTCVESASHQITNANANSQIGAEVQQTKNSHTSATDLMDTPGTSKPMRKDTKKLTDAALQSHEKNTRTMTHSLPEVRDGLLATNCNFSHSYPPRCPPRILRGLVASVWSILVCEVGCH